MQALCLIFGILALLISTATPAGAQTCLHEGRETPAERNRRTDALIAVRLINTTEAGLRQFRDLPQLANAPAVVAMRSDGGQAGKVARALQWESQELLPGWRAHFVVTDTHYALSLSDTRDACGFTYSTNEMGVIVEGYPIGKSGVRLLVPTTSP